MLLHISATIALCIGHFALLVEVFDQQWASKSLHKHDAYVAVNVAINLTVMVPGASILSNKPTIASQFVNNLPNNSANAKN